MLIKKEESLTAGTLNALILACPFWIAVVSVVIYFTCNG